MKIRLVAEFPDVPDADAFAIELFKAHLTVGLGITGRAALGMPYGTAVQIVSVEPVAEDEVPV